MNRSRIHVQVVLSLALVTLVSVPALAGPPRYGIRQSKVGKRTRVQAYSLKTGRPVWTRDYASLPGSWPDNGTFFWSRDRRAVAFAVQRPPVPEVGHEEFEGNPVIVWRAGGRVRNIGGFGEDYIEDMTWSPGDDYLIVRSGGSGMADADLGHTVCLETVHWRSCWLGDLIGRPRWIGPHTLKFWARSADSPTARAHHPTVWHAPHRQGSPQPRQKTHR